MRTGCATAVPTSTCRTGERKPAAAARHQSSVRMDATGRAPMNAATCRVRIGSCSCCRRRRSWPVTSASSARRYWRRSKRGTLSTWRLCAPATSASCSTWRCRSGRTQWREADWQRQALLKTKEVAQTNRRYYATLIQNGLNSGELQYLELNGVSLSTHASANVIEGVAEAMP